MDIEAPAKSLSGWDLQYVLENITGSICYVAMLMLFQYGTPNHDNTKGEEQTGTQLSTF